MSTKQILEELFGSIPENLKLQWFNLNFRKKGRNDEKIILNDVSGTAESNKITAIMGPSGSGKTTLLEGLACRSNNIKGTVTLNNNMMNNNLMQEISSFLPQFNITLECLTLLEYMEFISTLKLSNILDKFNRFERMSILIQKFGLRKCINTQISKLSGGERKRLFLIAALISDPAIIFCDEPTTGLDGYNALKIIENLNDFAIMGKIVLITIHQPSPDIIKKFDEIIMLSQGSIILHGTTDEISKFFTNLGILCPVSYNIAEFYIKQISVIPGHEEKCIEYIKELRRKFIMNKKEQSTNTFILWKDIKLQRRLKCNLLTQFKWLLWREIINMKRDFTALFFSFFLLMVTALIIGLFYSTSEHNLNEIQNTKGFVYLTASELIFTSCYSVVYVFLQHKTIFLVEKDLYSSIIYYIVKICIKIPDLVIYCYSVLGILFFFVPSSMDFKLYLNMGFVLTITTFTASAYGFMLSALFDTIEYIKLVIVPLDVVFVLTAGIFLSLRTLPYQLAWLKYLSSFHYAYEDLLILQIDNIVDSNATLAERSKEIFNEIGVDENNYYFNLYALLVLSAVMHLIGCCNLIRKRKTFNSLANKH